MTRLRAKASHGSRASSGGQGSGNSHALDASWRWRCTAHDEAERVVGKALEREYALTDLLRRPNVSYAQLMSITAVDGRRFADLTVTTDIAAQVEIQVKYAGYIDRQAKEVERHEHYEHLTLPADMD